MKQKIKEVLLNNILVVTIIWFLALILGIVLDLSWTRK